MESVVLGKVWIDSGWFRWKPEGVGLHMNLGGD